ncbi:hypothetical protein E2C01_052108 [Portunus trituberculatus]|uniref:Uncharacterized protein n=1 Tax=Portunus trituberculatus TaxID=210409 RepID=A0A5B7GKS5_PORTR|nr:hypothetical protein [Portunus trituberculatus]
MVPLYHDGPRDLRPPYLFSRCTQDHCMLPFDALKPRLAIKRLKTMKKDEARDKIPPSSNTNKTAC